MLFDPSLLFGFGSHEFLVGEGLELEMGGIGRGKLEGSGDSALWIDHDCNFSEDVFPLAGGVLAHLSRGAI